MSQSLPSNVETLLKDLQDTNPTRRKSVARALGKYGPKAEPVIQALRQIAGQDPDREVRQAAIGSLKALGDAEFTGTIELPPPIQHGGIAHQPELNFDPDATPLLPTVSIGLGVPSRSTRIILTVIVGVIALFIEDYWQTTPPGCIAVTIGRVALIFAGLGIIVVSLLLVFIAVRFLVMYRTNLPLPRSGLLLLVALSGLGVGSGAIAIALLLIV